MLAAAATPPSLVLRQFLQRPLAPFVATFAAHVWLAVADPTIILRQLSELDRVRAAVGALAVAAVASQAVLEGDDHSSSIEHKFDSCHNRQPISVISGTGLILLAPVGCGDRGPCHFRRWSGRGPRHHKVQLARQ